MTDLRQAIEEAAATPAKVEQDGTRVESRRIDELIQADRYLGAKRAKRGGVRMQRVIPPGATGA